MTSGVGAYKVCQVDPVMMPDPHSDRVMNTLAVWQCPPNQTSTSNARRGIAGPAHMSSHMGRSSSPLEVSLTSNVSTRSAGNWGKSTAKANRLANDVFTRRRLFRVG